MLAQVYRLINKYGAQVAVTRVDPPGPATTVTVRGMKRRAAEMPLVGDVSQTRLTYYLNHSSLVAEGFPTPIVKGDRIVSAQGQVAVADTIEELHDNRGAVGAYRIQVKGH